MRYVPISNLDFQYFFCFFLSHFLTRCPLFFVLLPHQDANTAIQLWRAGHAPTPNTQNIYVLCHGNTRDLRWTRRSDSLQCAHTCAHILAAHIVSPSRIARLARERMANKARLESEISEAKQHGGRLQSGALPFRGHMACCNRGMCVN